MKSLPLTRKHKEMVYAHLERKGTLKGLPPPLNRLSPADLGTCHEFWRKRSKKAMQAGKTATVVSDMFKLATNRSPDFRVTFDLPRRCPNDTDGDGDCHLCVVRGQRVKECTYDHSK